MNTLGNESAILIGLKRQKEKDIHGKDVYAFYTSTREEAELLKSVIDNQSAICVVVDRKVSESSETKVRKARKASD